MITKEYQKALQRGLSALTREIQTEWIQRTLRYNICGFGQILTKIFKSSQQNPRNYLEQRRKQWVALCCCVNFGCRGPCVNSHRWLSTWGAALWERAGTRGWQQDQTWVNIMPCVVGMAGSMPSCASRSNMAKTLLLFSQHSLKHSWNSESTFGPYGTRRTSINWNEFSVGLPLMVKSGALKGATEAPGNLQSWKGMAPRAVPTKQY